MYKNTGADKTEQHFFATWTSHRHPVKPEMPIRFQQIPEMEVFYRATFKTIHNRKLLVNFEKFRVNSENIDADNTNLKQGYYDVATQNDGKDHPGLTLTEKAAFENGQWFIVKHNSDKTVTLVKISLISKMTYFYDALFKVAEVTIEDEKGNHIHS